jgi:predicted kinase
MRKWMSDRLKRRKKGGEGTASDKAKAPEPLQPKYFETEIGEGGQPEAPQAPSAETAKEARAEPRHNGRKETQADFQLESRPEVESQAEPKMADAPTGEAGSRPVRRRRRRGGRGGSSRRGAAEVAGAAASSQQAEDADVVPSDTLDASLLAEPLTPESAVAEPTAAVPAAVSETPRHSTVPAATARPSKGTVVLAIGLPGSGKSSWFKRHNIHPLSSDLLRELLFDDAQEQRFQDLVFSNLRSMLKARLIARRPMNYVDATNLTPHDRHSWIKLAKDYGYDVQGVFFDVPLEICLERHQRRGRVVPESIMRKMADKLKPPTFEEGFSKLTVVRVKQKGATAT